MVGAFTTPLSNTGKADNESLRLWNMLNNIVNHSDQSAFIDQLTVTDSQNKYFFHHGITHRISGEAADR